MPKNRHLANIYIPEVSLTLDGDELLEAWALHCQQKILFRELLEGDASHEELLDGIEYCIGTGAMDKYLLDVAPNLDELKNKLILI